MTTDIIPRTHDKLMPLDDLMVLVDAGDWDARAIFGARLYFGDGVRQDPHKALDILHQASEAGSARAAAELGFRYVDGHGVLPVDPEKSEQYCALALARGNAFGWIPRFYRALDEKRYDDAFEAGCTFAKAVSETECSADLCYEIGWVGDHAKRWSEAAPYYKKAAEGGNPSAAINLALMIWRGDVDLPNDQVIQLLRQATVIQSPAGKVMFVKFLCFGKDSTPEQTPDLLEDAVAYLKTLIGDDQDYHYAYHYMSKLYERGLGVHEDAVESTRLQALAADYEKAGDGPPYVVPLGAASLEYARRLRVGYGTDVDLKKAMDYCLRASTSATEMINNANYARPQSIIDYAAFLAIEIAQASNKLTLKLKCLPLLEAGASTGNVDMILPYAMMLSDSTSFKKARFWFILGIAINIPQAGVEAANICLSNGQLGEAYAFAQAARAAGDSLPQPLAALTAHGRDKGLFKKGKSGAEHLTALKPEIAQTKMTYDENGDTTAAI